MKKIKLFLAAAAATVGLGAQAQTTLSGVSEITSGEGYYIVNDATGLFLTPGNDYGTRATLDQSSAGPATVTLADGKYTIVWPQKGDGLFVNADDGSSLYCDRGSQDSYYWSITTNGDNTFNLQLASDQSKYVEGSYLTAENGNIFANVQYNSNNESLRKWRFISPSALKEAMPSSTSKMDVSLFIHGAQCMIRDKNIGQFKAMYPWITSGNNWQGQNNANLTGFTKPWLECWNGSALTDRSAKNTISSLPAGSYTLSAYTIGGNGVTFYAKVGEGEKLTAETGNGSPILSTIEFDIESGSQDVEIGIESSSTSTSGWIAIDNIKLEYVSFVGFLNVYNEALEAAKTASATLNGFSVYASAKSTLDGVISSNTLTGDDLSNRTALQTATTALDAATAAVAAQVAACNNYAAVVSAIGGGTNVDLTSYVTNAGFEQGNLTGWTSVDGGGVASNNNFSGKVGAYFVERWRANGETQAQLSDGSLTHDDIVLPAGIYKITANGQNIEQKNGGAAGTGYFLCANDERAEMGAAGSYSTNVVLTDKQVLSIKFLLENCSGNWVSCDNVTLTYVGSDFPAYTLVEGKMRSDAAAAQTAADAAFKADKTVANYNVLSAAIATAQISKDAYAAAANAISKANALKEAHNFASAAAVTTFADAIAAIQTGYDEGTLADNDANNAATTLGVGLTGWRAGNNNAAAVYMRDGFNLGDFLADPALHVNTWSTEGNNDGSGFTAPFYESWTGDANSLPEEAISGTLTGLPKGLYSITALVRVRAKDGVDATEATGITMNVNGGDAMDVTEGTKVGDTQFQINEYTAEGLVKDGNLSLNFDVTAEANISWLSFKNVKYTKVRDLTPEEEIVVPTAFALSEPMLELNAVKTTATLTVNPTPADAFTGVTWTSSDESVATVVDGVVTAVAPGTATITATSTVAAVSAQATVSVNLEAEMPAAIASIVDGPRIIDGTFAKNLIANGTFEGTDAFFGWTSANDYTTKLTASNFTIKSDAEGNKYLVGTANAGAAGAASIGTTWAIEPGKTYQFSYQVKKEGSGSNYSYLKTSLTNTAGTETKILGYPSEINSDWTNISYTFTNGEEGEDDCYSFLQVAFRWLNGQWGFDNFYLGEVIATETGNVQYALDAIPTANIGDAAFQIPQSAIDAANALVQGTATVAEVEEAYAAVTTLNAPDAAQAYNLVFNCEGHTATGNALTLIPNPAQTQGGYGLKYLAPANTNLAQAFYFTHVEGNKYKLHAIDQDGQARYITTQAEGYGTTWYDGIRTTEEAEKAMAVEIRPNGEGLYLLWNTGANLPLAHNGNNNNDLFTNNTADFQLVETSKASVTINTTAAGWGTAMLPFAVASLPAGVKAYTCAAVDGNMLTLEAVDALEANKPYIIEGAWNETLEGDAMGAALTYTEGLLTGVYAATAAPADSYVLQNQDGKVAFYVVGSEDGDATPTVGANHAYLTVPAAAVKAFYFDGTTGIDAAEGAEKSDVIYDLSGRRVSKAVKGIYIINGKKILK